MAVSPRFASIRDRAGFSLIEALVVLAIGGMALAIIFSIGVKAGDTGFGLGRRALSAADADLTTSDVRTLIRSLTVRPPATFMAGVDQPIVGAADRLEGDVVMERATQCAPQGWAGRMVLAIERRGGDLVLTCRAGDRSAVMVDLGGTQATFSYSLDGTTWAPAYTNLRRAPEGFLMSETVWIRFAAQPRIDLVEAATSSRPEAWVRLDG